MFECMGNSFFSGALITLEENDLNGLARTVLHILLCIMFCCFQRERMGSIQEFQSMVLNLENKRRMQGKEMGRNALAHR